MKNKILTAAILMGLLAGQTSYFLPSAYAARLTRTQKKEQVFTNAAWTSFQEKHYDVAIEYYTKAIEVNPDNAESYAKRGNAKFLLGKYNEAVLDYTKAIELDPNRANLYYNRGLAKANLNAYEEVLEDYTKELEINPNNSNAYLNRGTTRVLLGQYDSAIEDFSKVIELEPKNILG